MKILSLDRPYEGMNIYSTISLTTAQRATLCALGAIVDRAIAPFKAQEISIFNWSAPLIKNQNCIMNDHPQQPTETVETQTVETETVETLRQPINLENKPEPDLVEGV